VGNAMQIRRRELLKTGTLAAAGVALGSRAAGALAPASARAADVAAKVTFWHANSGPLGSILEALVSQFNATHPRAQVQAEFVGTYTTLNQKIMSAVAAGAQPNAAQAGAFGAVAEYMAENLIVPVQKFVDGPDGLSRQSLADIFPGFLEDNTLVLGGRPALVSWPFNKSVMVLYYNGTMLKNLRLGVPRTWDQFASAAQKVMQAGKAAAGLGWTPATDWFAALLIQNGGRLLSPDGRQAEFQSDAGVRALGFLKDLYDRKLMYLTKQYDWQNDLVAQKIAFGISTIVSQQYIQQDLKGAWDLGVAPLPAGPRPATVLFGSNGVIFARARPEAQAAAWTFFKWWAEPQQTALWSVQSHYLPLRRSALDTQIMKHLFAQDPRQRVALDSLDYAHPMPDNVAAWVRIDPVLTDALTKGILGLATPRAALQEAAARAATILRA
jgi:ABC-type glycerol-3-phosphate transport system substrate-binding protein